MRAPLSAAIAVTVLGITAPAHAAEQGTAVEFPSARAAQGVCQCMIQFGNRYVHSRTLRRRVARSMMRRGVQPEGRKGTKRAIYDWQRDHEHTPNWCRRSEFGRKACAAAIVCITAAGATLANDGTDGRAWRHAATNCAAAAAAVWLSP